jgi:NADH-quinone oxidoreductase subunit J
MELAVFSVFAFLALVSAVVVVVHRNPVYSTMSLVVTLFSLAVLFVLLGAPFIATLQVLVYAGAILVLFLFVIMLLNVGRPGTAEEEAAAPGGGRLTGQRLGAAVGAAVFAVAVGVALWRAYGATDAGPLDPGLVTLKPLAAALFDRYLLAFEIVGLLLLVAVIAASVLARKAPPGREEA